MKIPGAFLILPSIHYDERGSLLKDYSAAFFQEQKIPLEVKETFYSYSHQGVLRGIHFQRKNQQMKLLRCVYGKVFDVCVDLRKTSPTFGEWIGVELSANNHRMILIPEGCGHGFFAIEESIVSYKCSKDYDKDTDDGICYSDPDIRIQWPVLEKTQLLISARDRQLQSLKQFVATYGGL